MKAFEYTTIPYETINEEYKNPDFFNEKFRKGFEEYLRNQELQNSLYLYNQQIKTTSFVGVVKYKAFQLDILPKLLSRISSDNTDKDGYNKYEKIPASVDLIIKNLLFILSKTEELDIKYTEYSNINNCDNPFLEILIREYAVSLFECLKRLTPRNYVREEENLNYLKGKLKFTENIRYNCANKAKFYCEYDEFSENNELNRLFLFISKCLFNISQNSENKKILSFIMNYFCDLPFEKTDKYKAEKIILSRSQKLFELPFRLAKMFLKHLSVDITKNAIENITILWDMNKLFEEFVYVLLKKGQSEYSVSPQEKKPLLKKGNNEYRDTFVDVYLEKDETKIVLDTKYKIDSFANADIYQVCTYCLLHKANNAILFYPMKYKQDDEQNYFYFNIENSPQLNTDEVDVRIHKIYINLYHKELSQIFSKAEELVGLLDKIL